MKSEDKMHIHIMRILACIMVIFNHTQENGFLLYIYEQPESIKYWLYACIAVFTKANVPIFLMISGALFLNREISIKDIYCKRIPKILSVLILFSFISYLELVWLGQMKFSLKDFWKIIYSSEMINWSYWYLYGYIAYLISMPFLKSIVNIMDDAMFIYLILLNIFISGIYPIMNYFLFEDDISIYSYILPNWIISTFVFYPVVGAYLEKIEIKSMERYVCKLLLINCIGIILSAFMTYYRCTIKLEGYVEMRESFNSSFTVINAVMIYTIIKIKCTKIEFSQKVNQFIYSISRCTFGIYLLHIIIMRIPFMEMLWKIGDYYELNQMLIAFIYTIVVFILGIYITYILRLIPGIRRLL